MRVPRPCAGSLLTIGSDRTDAHFACQSGRADVLASAINTGVDLAATDHNGSTSLHIACRKGSRGCVRLLLEQAADEESSQKLRKLRVNGRDQAGRTPLHHAALCGDPIIIELLVAHGADTQAMDYGLQTPVDVAGSAEAFVKLAAAAQVYNCCERCEAAVLRLQNVRSTAPDGIYDLLRCATDKEKIAVDELAEITHNIHNAEQRFMLQRELNVLSCSSQRRRSSLATSAKRRSVAAGIPRRESKAALFLRSMGHNI
mmetsp:Transcript_15521/g.46355  ORF Transcript_15521/g.46355 Transcript_15521/m.46355 type:complete len:258 (-) Transcript_15521:191-964(-)|eukprot:CAMPEP_0119272934 /NCGR_PEP_ID=MMETSP1329-20130426/9199_1 /TAXON_ID=114041 /ORGANISM="Genus nov. species nov., Strain RCC1024" /LENGTH=257 /DNA_ID=CAMNT_0007273053 /DNA_START=112 /DNA_END=885 /DNA_ORIENTATION=+